VRSKPASELGPEDGHMERLASVEGREIFRERKVEPEEGHDQQEDSKIIEMDRLR